MEGAPPAQTPDQVANLVSCKICGLVKTYKQFYEHGCENCPFLGIRLDRNRVDDCTTVSFNGIISTMDPTRSWASKWCHIADLAPGVYCLSVDEDISYDLKEELEMQGIAYRIRSEHFYPAAES
ncbi:hypothetical protein BSKO_01625 [Bryopsis sp. KO-2023]|nr:hypothetical protein BSKO_01625 [Bryopsis sp. KO-2023]